MLREINQRMYCVTYYSGCKRFVECTDENELAVYIAQNECKGYSVTSVVEIRPDGCRPRVAIKYNTVYKKMVKELLDIA